MIVECYLLGTPESENQVLLQPAMVFGHFATGTHRISATRRLNNRLRTWTWGGGREDQIYSKPRGKR